jgi:hypothetical protein
MRHPTEGVLRRLLDEPAGIPDADRTHVDGCAQCRSELAAGREEADLVAAALTPGEPADVDAAWRRLSHATADPSTQVVVPLRGGRARGLLRRPAAAALAVALVVTGAGAAAANDWLQVFRTEKLAPVSITTSDLVALPDLSAYGTLDVTQEPDVQEVADAAAATAASGLDLPEVDDLPRGVTGEPTYQVGSKAIASFTFSAARAAQAAQAEGRTLPTPPPGVDGSTVRLEAGPGVAQLWRSSAGAPALVVGRAVAPTAFSSSGVRFEVVRDYLLSLPGLPPQVAEQLKAFAADGSTLPLPVPADRFTSRSVEVDGAPATLLETRDRTLAAVVWVEDGLVTLVAGSLDDDEVLAVARELG